MHKDDSNFVIDLSEDRIECVKQEVKKLNKIIKTNKEKLLELFSENKELRRLDLNKLNDKDVIAMFDSFLTRTLKMKQDELYDDLIIVKTYYYDILKDLVTNGFVTNKNEKYIVFTASAGQIRTKKTVFIKESVWEKHKNTLMCGLTLDKINEMGGVNVNKYLAYLALCNSATDEWVEFDIDKSIVVDDMETLVNGDVDFIDHKTYTITRKNMNIPITHTDGCGMILPKLSNKNFMVRLPWIKGLLASFDFVKFIEEANEKNPNINHGIVKDIYGKEYDIIKDDIQIIFTKSQFKMWKYYSSWDEYKESYKRYNCSAGKCNEEEDQFDDARLNYQMLQTLIDITDDELEVICERTKKKIHSIAKDRKTMLEVFRATDDNLHKNSFQQALFLYEELLQDEYTVNTLRDIKRSIVKEAWSAKVDLNAKYTFLIPDLYAFCEYMFLKNKNPEGLLKNGEVYCKLFPDSPKLDCLRSPHLFMEHAVRRNVMDDEKNKWFCTYGIYTSCHDLISKILQFDNDGDTSLVCADETIISVAERNVKKYNIVPLYYEMASAKAHEINNQVIYEGLIAAYSGGNIGEISNHITKIWNSEKIDDNAVKAVKFLCMENNFVIDWFSVALHSNM